MSPIEMVTTLHAGTIKGDFSLWDGGYKNYGFYGIVVAA